MHYHVSEVFSSPSDTAPSSSTIDAREEGPLYCDRSRACDTPPNMADGMGQCDNMTHWSAGKPSNSEHEVRA